MKRFFKSVFLLILVLSLTLFVLPTSASIADMGNFAGDSDFGGGFDFGGGDFGGNYNGFGGGYYGGDDFDTSSITEIIIIFAVVIMVLLVVINKGRRANNTVKMNDTTRGNFNTASDAKLKPALEYEKLDPAFNEVNFKEDISNIYVRMQNCWTAGDISPVRFFFTDALYNQFNIQLQDIKNAGRTNYVDRIAVLNVEVKGWYQDGEDDNMVVGVKTRIVDYTKDNKTGEIISGSDKRELFMEYEWILQRPTGRTSLKRTGLNTINCPHCNAPIEINQSAKCEYCGTIVQSGDHDWVISQIKAISQQSQL